jgi:hypothetical protein
MSDRPEEIERLKDILRGAGLAHEVIFDLHRRLLDSDPSRTDSLELVAESARIATVRLPQLTAGLRGLASRWDEQSLPGPEAANRTAELLARELHSPRCLRRPSPELITYRASGSLPVDLPTGSARRLHRR